MNHLRTKFQSYFIRRAGPHLFDVKLIKSMQNDRPCSVITISLPMPSDGVDEINESPRREVAA